MPFVPVPQGKAVVRDLPEGVEIVMPSRRSIFTTLFLGFWLIGWACGEVFALAALIAPKSGQPPELFLIAWLGAWTVGGAVAIYTWAWIAFGWERVTLGAAALTVRREVLGYGRSRDFDLTHVRNLRVAPIPSSPIDSSSSAQVWGLSGGAIAFDYGARTFGFGGALDEAEARQVVTVLRARQASLGQTGL